MTPDTRDKQNGDKVRCAGESSHVQDTQQVDIPSMTTIEGGKERNEGTTDLSFFLFLFKFNFLLLSNHNHQSETTERKHKDGTNQRERERATRAMIIRAVLNVFIDVYGHTHENVPVPVPLTEVKLVMV